MVWVVTSHLRIRRKSMEWKEMDEDAKMAFQLFLAHFSFC